MIWCARNYQWPPEVTLRQDIRYLKLLNDSWG